MCNGDTSSHAHESYLHFRPQRGRGAPGQKPWGSGHGPPLVLDALIGPQGGSIRDRGGQERPVVWARGSRGPLGLPTLRPPMPIYITVKTASPSGGGLADYRTGEREEPAAPRSAPARSAPRPAPAWALPGGPARCRKHPQPAPARADPGSARISAVFFFLAG